MKPKIVDILILGGGLVGLSAAHLLSKQNFQVGVIEKEKPDFSKEDPEFDLRYSAISKASRDLFQQLGVWEGMTSKRVSPYRRMLIWDALGFGELTFDAADVAEPDLGHIIENRVMLQALWEQAEQDSNIHLMTSAKPVAFTVGKEAVTLELEGGTCWPASCLIGADGGKSWLREHFSCKTIRHDYQQRALIATVKTEYPHAETAWQRFLPEGPLAFLPLVDSHLCSIVWTADPVTIEASMSLSESAFCEELAHRFDYRLGNILSSSKRLSYPLVRQRAEPTVSERIALIGDAAHVIHPLAGQGVNLGLFDAKQLAAEFAEASQQGIDIGHPLILRRFERACKGKVMRTMMAMDSLNKTFSGQHSWAIGLRSLGLNWINKTKFLKKALILEAMGI